MSAPMSKKQFNALNKNQRAALVPTIVVGKGKKRRARRARNQNPPQKSVSQPRRNGQGRRRGGRRQRGGNNQVTTAGNMRSFIVPIDEQVALVSGTTGFGIASYSLNPGNATCFPFASRTCQNYERYEFQNLRFEYRPSASVFATVGAQGFVGLTGTMDALQAPPSSQAQAEVMHHSPIVETAKPTALSLPKEFLLTRSSRERFFVRQSGNIPGGADPHTYDCGQIFIWTNGQANTNQIGELRVVGSVKLSNPSLETSTSVPPQFMVSQFTTNTSEATANNVYQVVAFGTTVTNGLSAVNTAGSFVLPVGNYIMDAYVNWNGTSITGTALDPQKNGVSIIPLAYQPAENSSGQPIYVSMQPVFFTSNGTDTFRIRAVSSQTGAGTLFGVLRIVAV